MSEEQVWVHHPGLDRWSEVPETSLDTWADLGWDFHPEGPPSATLAARYSDEELVKRAAELGEPAPMLEEVTAPEPPVQTSDEEPPEVSIQTPEPPTSTDAAS